MLPRASALEWPQEPFRSQFLEVLSGLEMPRFTRRHPQLLPALLRQFLTLVSVRGLGPSAGGQAGWEGMKCRQAMALEEAGIWSR